MFWMSGISTPRLRELEAALPGFSAGGFHNVGHQLKIDGYKMALEDLVPVLTAAMRYVENNSQETYAVLRDALLEFWVPYHNEPVLGDGGPQTVEDGS